MNESSVRYRFILEFLEEWMPAIIAIAVILFYCGLLWIWMLPVRHGAPLFDMSWASWVLYFLIILMVALPNALLRAFVRRVSNHYPSESGIQAPARDAEYPPAHTKTKFL